MFQLSSFKKNLDSLVAAVAGFFIIYLFTRHSGIGICPDGVVYTTTAENLRTNGTLTDFTHHPTVNFPVFYPLFLYGITWITGLKPLLFGAVLNALLFATVIYLSGQIMEQFSIRSTWYKRAVLSCIVLSPCLLEVYSMLWSETIFIFLLLLFMMAMHRYFQIYSRRILFAAAIIASFACITRYAGVTIIGAGGIFLLFDRKLLMRRKITDLFLFSVTSSALLIINLVRNYMVSTTAAGMREKAIATLTKNLHDTGVVFYDWLPFINGHYQGAASAAVLFIALLAFICIRQFRRNNTLATYESMAAVYALVYILFMVMIASISRFETLNSRFFSPAFIFIIWTCSSWIVSLTRRIGTAKKKWITILGIIIFLSFQYGQLNADYETWDGVKDAGIPGYAEDQWTLSETVKFIQNDSLLFQKGKTVYSNAYDAVYFFTHKPGEFLPHKESYPEISHFLNDQHCYAIWFTDGIDPDEVDTTFITKVKKMKLLKQFSDGAVYEFDK